uniref:Uncharacterized protein n=1 Tax=Octopus bimaculoides TaxID=37653 RepID=A0A0L8IBB7_OCTBM
MRLVCWSPGIQIHSRILVFFLGKIPEITFLRSPGSGKNILANRHKKKGTHSTIIFLSRSFTKENNNHIPLQMAIYVWLYNWLAILLPYIS